MTSTPITDAARSGDPAELRRAVLTHLAERFEAGLPAREAAAVSRRMAAIADDLTNAAPPADDPAARFIHAAPVADGEAVPPAIGHATRYKPDAYKRPRDRTGERI